MGHLCEELDTAIERLRKITTASKSKIPHPVGNFHRITLHVGWIQNVLELPCPMWWRRCHGIPIGEIEDALPHLRDQDTSYDWTKARISHISKVYSLKLTFTLVVLQLLSVIASIDVSNSWTLIWLVSTWGLQTLRKEIWRVFSGMRQVILPSAKKKLEAEKESLTDTFMCLPRRHPEKPPLNFLLHGIRRPRSTLY